MDVDSNYNEIVFIKNNNNDYHHLNTCELYELYKFFNYGF